MRIFRMSNNYMFLNETIGSRSGFTHKSTLFKEDYQIAEGKAHYINRTWENYAYETSMRICIDNAIEEKTQEIINNYKHMNNISRLTKKHKAVVDTIIANDEAIKEFIALKQELKDNERWF